MPVQLCSGGVASAALGQNLSYCPLQQELAPYPVVADRHLEDIHRAWPSRQGCYSRRSLQQSSPGKIHAEHQRGGEHKDHTQSGSASQSTLRPQEDRTLRASSGLMMPAHGPSGPCRSTMYSGELRTSPVACPFVTRRSALLNVPTCVALAAGRSGSRVNKSLSTDHYLLSLFRRRDHPSSLLDGSSSMGGICLPSAGLPSAGLPGLPPQPQADAGQSLGTTLHNMVRAAAPSRQRPRALSPKQVCSSRWPVQVCAELVVFAPMPEPVCFPERAAPLCHHCHSTV